MSGSQGDEMQKCKLSAAMTVSERMNGVYFTEELCGGGDEHIAVYARQEALRPRRVNSKSICGRMYSGKQNQLPPFAVRTVR